MEEQPETKDLDELLKHAVTVPPDEPPPPSQHRLGDRRTCPVDGGEMVFTQGLTYIGSNLLGVVSVGNLRGFVCATCHERHFDGPSYEAIRTAVDQAPKAFASHARASKLARGAVGMYFPRDVREYHGIEAGDDIELQPLGPGILLLTVSGKAERAAEAA